MKQSQENQETENARRARAAARRSRMVGHRTTSFEDAERWDLDFWQSCTPDQV